MGRWIIVSAVKPAEGRSRSPASKVKSPLTGNALGLNTEATENRRSRVPLAAVLDVRHWLDLFPKLDSALTPVSSVSASYVFIFCCAGSNMRLRLLRCIPSCCLRESSHHCPQAVALLHRLGDIWLVQIAEGKRSIRSGYP